MIKIPGTDEGVPAIEQAIYEGINVNVTLLFAVEPYAEVAEAYIRGLERRHDEGKSLDVHSVASFFVSRVDTEVDKRLEALGRTDLQGTAARRQRARRLRSASRRSSTASASPRCARPARPVQRPLWASTGIEEPALPGHEVRRRAGRRRDTVNTMPMATLLARRRARRGHRRDRRRRPDAPTLEALADAGIDMDDVTDKLLRRRHRAVRRRDATSCSRGSRRSRAAVVTGRPPRSSATPARARAARSPSASSARRRRTSRSASGDVTSRSGAAQACPRSATGSAG